jgi:hypothetical protein
MLKGSSKTTRERQRDTFFCILKQFWVERDDTKWLRLSIGLFSRNVLSFELWTFQDAQKRNPADQSSFQKVWIEETLTSFWSYRFLGVSRFSFNFHERSIVIQNIRPLSASIVIQWIHFSYLWFEYLSSDSNDPSISFPSSKERNASDYRFVHKSQNLDDSVVTSTPVRQNVGADQLRRLHWRPYLW